MRAADSLVVVSTVVAADSLVVVSAVVAVVKFLVRLFLVLHIVVFDLMVRVDVRAEGAVRMDARAEGEVRMVVAGEMMDVELRVLAVLGLALVLLFLILH
jgi:hypothetical protein